MIDWTQLMVLGGGSFLTGLDGLTVMVLLGVAIFYFLAPVLGYRPEDRGMLLGALWVLIGKLSLGVLRACVLFLHLMDNSSSGSVLGTRGGVASSNELHALLMLLFVVESILFVVAMILFLRGLMNLRRGATFPAPIRRDPNED